MTPSATWACRRPCCGSRWRRAPGGPGRPRRAAGRCRRSRGCASRGRGGTPTAWTVRPRARRPAPGRTEHWVPGLSHSVTQARWPRCIQPRLVLRCEGRECGGHGLDPGRASADARRSARTRRPDEVLGVQDWDRELAAAGDTGVSSGTSWSAGRLVTRSTSSRGGTVMRAGEGRIPRLWSIVTDEVNARWCRLAHGRARAAGPGPGCGRDRRAPRPRRAARRPGGTSSRRPPLGAEGGERGRGVGSQVGEATEEQRADQHQLLRREGCWPATSTGVVVTRAVSQVGGLRRRVSHTAWSGSTGARPIGRPGGPVARTRRRSAPGCPPPAWWPRRRGCRSMPQSSRTPRQGVLEVDPGAVLGATDAAPAPGCSAGWRSPGRGRRSRRGPGRPPGRAASRRGR